MNVDTLRRYARKIRRLQPWHFLLLAGLCLIVGVLAMRANYARMTELREAVYVADQNNGDVAGALTSLQRHVTSHMNTGLSAGSNAVYPPIQLKYTYERLREANLKTDNEQLYIDAQAHCERLNPTDFSGRNRVPCIQQYVESNGAQQKAVPENLYKFDFVAPLWSPDLAGLSLLAAGAFALAGLAMRLIARRRRV